MEGKAGSQPAAGAERAQSYAMQPTDRLGYKTCSNGEQHVKSNIVGVEKLDALDVSHHLLKEIDNRLNGLSCSAPEDASSDNSNVGGASLGAGHGMQTPSHAYDGYTTGMGGSGPVCQ